MPYYFPKEIPDIIHNSKPRIVFLLLVNGRSLLQVHRLLSNIYSTHHYYYIHVDLVIFYKFNISTFNLVFYWTAPYIFIQRTTSP